MMQYMGHEYVIPACFPGLFSNVTLSFFSGYLESCRSIVGCARKIKKAIEKEIPELYILGEPPASVIAFGSTDAAVVNVHEVGDAMSKRGWHLSSLSYPAGIHIACTVSERFLSPDISLILLFFSKAVDSQRL